MLAVTSRTRSFIRQITIGLAAFAVWLVVGVATYQKIPATCQPSLRCSQRAPKPSDSSSNELAFAQTTLHVEREAVCMNVGAREQNRDVGCRNQPDDTGHGRAPTRKLVNCSTKARIQPFWIAGPGTSMRPAMLSSQPSAWAASRCWFRFRCVRHRCFIAADPAR